MKKLKPHCEYKDSGISWLGKVPKHWEVTRFNNVSWIKSSCGRPELNLLSVYLNRGVIAFSDVDEKRTNATAESLDAYQVAEPGDLVLNNQQAWRGSVGVAFQHGIVSPAYLILGLRSDIDSRFANWLFRSCDMVCNYVVCSKGVGTIQRNLHWPLLKDAKVWLPPHNEQTAIARFLGALDLRVNRFVRAKRRLIELLTEQKQAIITHAVTRGLNAKAKLKPSGVDWLGNVPENWDIVLNQRIFREEVRPHNGRLETQLSLSQRDGLIPTKDMQERSLQTASFDNWKVVAPGDLVLNRFKAHLGVFFAATLRGIVSFHYGVFAPRRRLVSKYYELLYHTDVYRTTYAGRSNGMTVGLQNLSNQNFYSVRTLVPPFEEQEAIVAFSRDQSTEIDAAVARIRQEIALIREYRTRLVADVVTGKLDVRFAIAEPNESTNLKPKANVHFQRSVFAAEIVHRLYSEPTFGHVKFEKLIYLCEKRCGIDTGSTYRRQAAGPYDSRALRSIDKQMKKQNWYEARKVEKAYRYFPCAKAGAHSKYFDRYFANVVPAFDAIVDIFRTAKTRQCEIVATLYSAWEDLLAKGNATDDQIVDQVLHHWHPSKQRIEEDRWRRALEWMKKKGLTPEEA